MRFRRGLRTVTAGPGDLVVVEPGTYHRFANVGDEPAIVRVRVTPAVRMEELFETVAALAGEGGAVLSGLAGTLGVGVLVGGLEEVVGAGVGAAVGRGV